ncbi:MAG: PAS domain S-box protein [Synechocystis sp.]|nr:PAS domain S-box protein [Synechocystis sp.]
MMSALPSAKFLLVDDQADNLRLLADALSSLPVEITAVHSGEAAIAAVTASDFALIVLDVKMPGLDGFQTAAQIRALPQGSSTPIIFITAHAIQPDDVIQGYETGAIDYLIKPLNLPIFVSKAKLYLEFYQQKQVLKADGDRQGQIARDELESLNRIVLSEISDAVFMTKASGEFTFICPNVHYIFGYTYQEVAAMERIQALLGELTLDTDELNAKGVLKNLAFTVYDKDHQCHHLLINIKKVQINGGDYLFSCRDISEQVQSEKLIQAGEEKYYHLLENIQSGVVVHDPSTRIIYANPIAKQFLGLSDLEAQETASQHWQLFSVEGEAIAQHDFPVHQVLATQAPVTNLEIGIYRHDLKAICWALVNAYPEFTEQQQIHQVIVTFVDITERKQAETILKNTNEHLSAIVEERTHILEATNEQLLSEIAEKETISQTLAHQEARYRALVRDASDVVVVTTMDLEILEVNHRAIDLSGYQESELLHQSLRNLNLFPENHLHRHRQFWRNLKANKIAQVSDTVLRKKSGEELSIDISASIISYGDDAIIKFIVHDITPQKAIQTQLERENHFRQQILDNIGDGLCVCHTIADFPFVRFTVWNPMMETITGYTQDEINQLGWYQQLYPDPDYQQQAIARMQAMRHGDDILAEEWQITRKDGDVRTVKISTTLLQNPFNDTSVLALIQDITYQKQQLKIIEENELTFRSIVENLPIFFGMRDPDYHQWYYINPAFEILTGYTTDAMYKDPLLWHQFFHPDDLAQFLEKTAVEFPYGEGSDIRICRQDGTEIWVQVTEFLIEEHYPEPRVISFGQDITDIKRAEAEIMKALAQERELNQIKSQFVDIVSHEFRTPLTSILGFSELLTRHFERLSAEKQLHYIINIKNASYRLNHLIDDVLRISHYDANKLEISLGRINIDAVAHEIIESLSVGAGKAHILQLNYHLPPGTNYLLDVNLLRHVLENLLGNAIKYSPEDSTVTLDISQAEDQLLFQVSDQGIGIPEADQGALFNAFHRASNVGKTPGTGLGLSIVKRYVQFQGGTIDFVSVPNQGTTFFVRLPLVVA